MHDFEWETLLRVYIVVCIAVHMQRPRDEFTRAVSMQRFCKYCPATTDTNAKIVQQQRNDVFYVVRAEMV
jgi:hypothetical protein